MATSSSGAADVGKEVDEMTSKDYYFDSYSHFGNLPSLSFLLFLLYVDLF